MSLSALFYITRFVSLQVANLCKPLIGYSVQQSGQAICTDKLFSDSANILTVYVMERWVSFHWTFHRLGEGRGRKFNCINEEILFHLKKLIFHQISFNEMHSPILLCTFTPKVFQQSFCPWFWSCIRRRWP
jgi:hypothetical protein